MIPHPTNMLAKSFLMLLLGLTLAAAAGDKMDIRGITVSISNGGTAYHDDDGTLTVETWFDYAKVKVTASSRALGGWGWYCDVYFLSDDKLVDKIQTKGTADTYLYIIGQTYHCDAFKGNLTFIGNTDAYGPDVGLGMTSWNLEGWPFPKQAALKSGWTTTFFLSRSIYEGEPGKSVETKLPKQATDILFDR